MKVNPFNILNDERITVVFLYMNRATVVDRGSILVWMQLLAKVSLLKIRYSLVTLSSMNTASPLPIQNYQHHEGKTYVAGVGEKGKITIPSQVRQHLNIHPKDKIVIRIEQGRAIIEGKLLTVEETAGVVSPLEPQRDWKDIQETVKEDVAQRYHEKFRT